MKYIFDKTTCWNIFDHAEDPERYWALQRAGHHEKARRAAMRLTLRHPFMMIPVIIACTRCGKLEGFQINLKPDTLTKEETAL